MSGLVLVVTAACAIAIYYVARSFDVTRNRAVVLALVSTIGGIAGAFHGPTAAPTAATAGASPPPYVALSPAQLAALRDTNRKAVGTIDGVTTVGGSGSYDAESAFVTTHNAAKLEIAGWIVDTGTPGQGTAVVAFLDRRVVREGEYGIERNDVAQYLRNPAYRWCGYRVVLTLRGLAPGRHTVSIGMVTERHVDYAALPRTLQLEIVRS